ncbi:hypothetical protein PENSPDRAFT_215474 [Peniophora sp. CONT]|nr:hypothetical protein PENSPDRAFT_215474 [Peniophora sp. CONT]
MCPYFPFSTSRLMATAGIYSPAARIDTVGRSDGLYAYIGCARRELQGPEVYVRDRSINIEAAEQSAHSWRDPLLARTHIVGERRAQRTVVAIEPLPDQPMEIDEPVADPPSVQARVIELYREASIRYVIIVRLGDEYTLELPGSIPALCHLYLLLIGEHLSTRINERSNPVSSLPYKHGNAQGLTTDRRFLTQFPQMRARQERAEFFIHWQLGLSEEIARMIVSNNDALNQFGTSVGPSVGIMRSSDWKDSVESFMAIDGVAENVGKDGGIADDEKRVMESWAGRIMDVLSDPMTMLSLHHADTEPV